jgi:hypothetical protein
MMPVTWDLMARIWIELKRSGNSEVRNLKSEIEKDEARLR